jgi:RimJ/RimL family protein N-acetyltransferase
MLRGKKIVLRTFLEKDLDRFHELDVDIANRGEYYPMMITTEPGLKKWFHETGLWDDNFGRMLIVDINDDDTILGYINYFKSVSYFSSLEIGYILFDNHLRGKGIITEALELFVEYLFSAKNINRLEIRTHPENQASQKVALKCGFVFEGKARGAVMNKDTYVDICEYSLLRNEYYQRKKKDEG